MEELALPVVADRVVIDRLHESDAAALAGSHSDATNARFQGWASPLSEEDARAFIDEQLGCWPLTPGGGVQLALRSPVDGELVGDLYLARPADESAVMHLGITLVPRWHGHGLAAAAVQLVVRETVDRPGSVLHEVLAFVDEENSASRRLFERCGFELVDRIVGGSERRDGAVADELVYRRRASSR